MYTFADKQRGGTVLGLIIGLIVGLGIAVAVALAITKSSLPFTNKAGRVDKSAEARAASGFDPNKSLYGNREPAREAAKAFSKENKEAKDGESKPAEDAAALAAADAKAASADKPKKSEAADAKAESKPESRNDIKLAKAEPRSAGDSKPDAIAKLAAEADAKSNTIYFLQAGAFRDQNDAESVRAKLALMGFEARISERPSENGALYRVRIGPVSQLEAMNKIRTKLSENGVDASVIRTTKQ